MSTRCNIVIKATDLDNGLRNEWAKVILYHHHDGYPEWIGKRLTEFIDEFNGDGMDDFVNKLLKDKNDTGYEYTHTLHGDIEYLYTIDFIYTLHNTKWECEIELHYQKVIGGTWDSLIFRERVFLTRKHLTTN